MKTPACVKTLLASIVLSFAVALGAPALAGTVMLPEPAVQQLNPGAFCAGSQTPNDVITRYARQAITGWSADGTQVYAKTYGSYPCGGRYSRGLTYYGWCGTFTWTLTFDASGNLNPIKVATYTPDPTPCAAPSYPNTWDSGATFYNSFDYGATVQLEYVDSGYFTIGVATLLTP